MDEQHIAKLIQILGLLIGTGFGTIFLNPAIVGKFAHRLNNKFLSLGDTLTEKFMKIMSFLMPGGDFPTILKQTVSSSLVICFAWIILLISLIFNIGWLFWVGVSFLGFYTLLGIIDIILRLVTKLPRRYPLWALPLFLIVRLISGLVLFPIIIALLLISTYVVLVIVLIFNSIARKDIVRRGLIISGFILILAGLIWEFSLID